MMNRKGQGTTEMVIIMPLLISLACGGMFLVYTSYQGIKTQQAANVAARIQSQERVGGGITKAAIQDTNGVGVDMTLSNGDEDPMEAEEGQKKFRQGAPAPASVYGRLRKVVRDMFGTGANQVYVPPPVIGQNIDKVKVVRVINLPKIPFFKWGDGKDQIKLEGTAWGGEDTLMYGLPRWSKTQNNADMEWRRMVGNAVSAQENDGVR